MAQTRKSTKKAAAKSKPATAKTTSTAKKTSAAKKSAAAKASPVALSESAPRAARSASNAAPRAASKDGKRASGAAAPAAVPPVMNEHPDLALARGLAEIVASYNLDKLVYDTGELSLSLERTSPHAAAPVAPAPVIEAAPAPAPIVSAPLVSAPEIGATRVQAGGPRTPTFAGQEPAALAGAYRERGHHEAPDGAYHIITSPFVGTFYRRPSPEADPYVTLGSRVAKGQVMCIIEAMKLMNEIESDASGTVADILVEDAQPVEYGQALFKILVA